MKACIIGAGIGGLASASLLLKEGYAVDVYEKEKMIGGRGLTIDEKISYGEYKNLLKRFDMYVPFAEPSLEEIFDGLINGYKMDLGFHLIGGGENASPIKILSSLGIKQDIIGSRLGFIGKKIEYPYLSMGDKIKMLPRILQLLFSRKETIAALESVSMEETIKRYGKGKMKLTLELFSRLITTVNDLSRISTGETFWAQRELMGSSPVSYPVGGLSSIAKNFAGWVEKKGGNLMHRKVDRIIIEDGTAKGISAGKEKDYDIVISSLPVQDTFSIADEKTFPKKWVSKIKNLEGTGSLCAYYALNGLNEKLIGKAFMFIERDAGIEGNDAVGMIDFKMASPEANTAPHGKYLIQSYVICTPDEAKNKKKIETLRNTLDKYLEKLVPDFRKKMEWCIYPAIWHLDGVAKTIDNEKSPAGTPIKNFFVVGDSIKAKGVGINCAADSANLLMKELGKK
ncbi:MAG: FAD-dependent oxidoreductase [Candidatus Thermoplasmatota archaeon]|nr:FAD-dependent oxidoreductase [Candidatus Thermoplasmatota archaeon]